MQTKALVRPQERFWAYLQMARVDHWFKNTFMLLGVLLALLYRPELLASSDLSLVALGILATCIVASSNYVLNEYLDAPMDRLHPTKCMRPAAQGLVTTWGALLLWGVLGMGGILLAMRVNWLCGAAALVFWFGACAYNVPPIRSKDVAYLDVLSESLNNPIRLFLGWFVLIPDVLPPLSLALAYWMLGAFFMATKRFAEYRSIDDPERAGRYRRSFRHYDEARLLGSMVFYAAAGAMFGGIFIVRYKLELIFCVPFVCALVGYYTALGLRKNSPVETPETLYRDRGFMALAALSLISFLALMFVDMPRLYEIFRVEASGIEPLWRLGR